MANGQGNLSKIDHVVVLMLENRSFDNMLGWLYDPSNQPPFDRVPRGQPFESLSGKNLSNPIPPGVPGADRKVVYAGKGTIMDYPNPDPGEEYDRVNTQLFGQPTQPNPVPHPAPLSGFVLDYVNAVSTSTKGPASYDEYSIIMDGFTPDMVPVISTLANAYAVCDQWHCSVPSQTMCNRSFFNAATSAGLVNNEPYVEWIHNTGATIFQRLEDAGQPWKVYYDPLDLVSLTWIIHRDLFGYYHDHFFHFDRFLQDAAAGTLPAYSFIEPRFLLAHNDQHPPYGVLPGEDLINQVYQAVRNSPAWEKTLLIITYDEHGGCYDHVSPPKIVPPGDGAICPEGFTFDRAGLRVPTVLISAWTEAGTVYRGARPLEHTSVIKTITNRWGLPPLTDRDRAAEDLNGALALSQPRTDYPVVKPRPLVPSPVASERELLSGLHRSMVGMLAARAGKEVPGMTMVGEAHEFIRQLLPSLLP